MLDRNWQGEEAELDLVAERDGRLRFVEVKARSSGESDGLDALDASKRRRLRRAAEAWLAERGAPDREAAFLVALVTTGPTGWSAEWWDDPF